MNNTEKRPKLNDLGKRVITGLVGAAVVISVIVFSSYGMLLFCAVVSLVGFWEFLRNFGMGDKKYTVTFLLAGLFLWLLFLLGLESQVLLPAAMLIFPLASMMSLFDKGNHTPVYVIAAVLMGFVYAFVPLIVLYRISFEPYPDGYDFWIPLGILIMIWGLDTAAYFSGRVLGKHKLFPRISPKKTWEGAIGGALFSMALGIVFEIYLPRAEFSWIVVAAIVSVFAQFGDLVESMFKRSREIKDSGQILPGHGGFLDRFDGIYLSLPVIYFYFSFI
jgi:phosphatidate cytidylyltransferase